MFRLLILSLLLAPAVSAQVAEVQAGASTLFQAEGAELTFFTPGTTETVGAGLVSGHLVAGASTAFGFHGWDVYAGDRFMSLNTGQAGTGFASRGLSTTKKTKDSELTLFIAATGRAYTTPFFNGTEARHFGTGAEYQRKLRHGFHAGFIGTMYGSLRTALEEAGWDYRAFKFVEDYGVIDSRINSNGSARYQARHFGGEIARQTSIWNNLQTVTNSESVAGDYRVFSGYASVFQSGQLSGQAVGGNVRLGPVSVSAGETFSRSGKQFLGSVTEQLRRGFSVTQYISRMNGTTNVNFGGVYTSNTITVSAQYQQVFTPFGPTAFEKILMLGFKLQLPSGQTVDLSTSGTKWSASGGSYIQTGLSTAGTSRTGGGVVGKYVIRGRVVDDAGQPVENAAVMVGNEEVFTNANGDFLVRTRKSKAVSVSVVVKDFVRFGDWTCTSCPASVVPQPDESATPVQIVVRMS